MVVMGKKTLLENSGFEKDYESRVSLVCLENIIYITVR